TLLAAAEAQLAKLKAQPRPEELPPLEARVQEATQSLADVEQELKLWESVADPRAISKDDLDRKGFAARVAKARLEAAQAELNVTKAGAWAPDMKVQEAQVEAAKAQVEATKIEIERLSVRAPIDAQVLQVKIRLGEFAQVGPLAQPLIVIGDVG